MSSELIFVVTPGVGHLVPTTEFAKILLNHHDRLLITILVVSLPNDSHADAYIKSSSQPRLQFLHLPQPPLTTLPSPELRTKSSEAYLYDYVLCSKHLVRKAVSDVLSSRRVAGLVLDLFCVSMVDVADEFGLPSYIFLTCSAGFLSLMFHLPDRDAQVGTIVQISDPDHAILGFQNPVPSKVLPLALTNKHGGYEAFVKIAQCFRKAKGILVNTFAELEDFALKSYSEAGIFPPIYSVGPLLNLKSQPHPDLDHSIWKEVMMWLDQQAESSVLFLCFGNNGGSFSVAQTKEIAAGLEKSGVKFLWTLYVKGLKHEDMLPEGFLGRVAGRGAVCSWAPQVEVLGHKAIGGFVSHCGWNSSLESLWLGVPIATLPLYAEQQLNAFEMVKELGVAVDLKMDHNGESGDLVMAEEIERGVRSVMESDNPVRKKAKDMGETAKKALMEGGSSFTSTQQFIKDMLPNN